MERIIIECEKSGLQVEVVVRKHSEIDPSRTHVFCPDKEQRKDAESALKKVFNKSLDD